MGRIIGIDLGTTNSAFAYLVAGKPEVIANAEGNRTTPSVVAVNKSGERLVGQVAQRQRVGGFRLVQDRTSDPPVLAFPRSITATVDDVSDVASPTDPCPHLEAVHMSESLKSTSDPCESALAEASYLSVDNVDQSDIPVTRVTVSPATHPMASCALASAMQTVWEDESDDTRILADVSTRSSTPGSVTT